jgi:hypothetical protein
MSSVPLHCHVCQQASSASSPSLADIAPGRGASPAPRDVTRDVARSPRPTPPRENPPHEAAITRVGMFGGLLHARSHANLAPILNQTPERRIGGDTRWGCCAPCPNGVGVSICTSGVLHARSYVNLGEVTQMPKRRTGPDKRWMRFRPHTSLQHDVVVTTCVVPTTSNFVVLVADIKAITIVCNFPLSCILFGLLSVL